MAGGLIPTGTNAPPQYADRQKQYYGPETSRFMQKYAKYASDYVSAQVQGLDPSNFLAWSNEYIRMADIVTASATTTKNIDDYKMIIFANEHVDYVPKGAKIVAMGSTWLVTNPANISSVIGNAVAQRCNAVWNHLDFYGNVLSEPIVIDSNLARANTNNVQEFVLLTKGYYNAKAQYNQYTAELGQNSRIILGNSAYAITGFTDFLQEFTGDYESVRMCEFSLNYEEPNKEIDDMENHVAGGLNFNWEIGITGPASVQAGQTAQLTAASIRNGASVINTEEYPITYNWSSSNTDIATVDENGLVTGVSAGTCQIICTLAQNTAYSTQYTINVEEALTGNYVSFSEPVPPTLDAYASTVITAAYYENGVKTTEPITWSFTNAPGNSFAAITDGNSATITCYGYSSLPLTVTASHGNTSATAQITLLGV